MEGRFLRALILTSQGCRKAEQLPRTGSSVVALAPFNSQTSVGLGPHKHEE
jgi:hypothetical protein